MMMRASESWLQANAAHLTAALARVRAQLERYVPQAGAVDGLSPGPGIAGSDGSGAEPGRGSEPGEAVLQTHPAALQQLERLFDLSPFERDLLLLCAAAEIDPMVPVLCGAALGVRRAQPSFGLALQVLPGGHWDAIEPGSSLRHYRLIRLGAGEGIAARPLYIPERVLHYLFGSDHLDEALEGLIEPVVPPDSLAPSQAEVATRMVRVWGRPGEPAAVLLCGEDRTPRMAIAAAACAELGLTLHVMRASDMPLELGEREALRHLWEREALLRGSALYLECGDAGGEALQAAIAFSERLEGVVVLGARDPLLTRRDLVRLDVPRLSTLERRTLWGQHLGGLAQRFNGHLEPIVAQFHLSEQGIASAAAETRARLNELPDAGLELALWESCRAWARPRLEELAERIEPAAGWDDLVVPDVQLKLLRDVAAHIRQRVRVYEGWGFAGRSTRGLGITALFSGSSGTGKTLAAEVLASDLRLDLFRIDLSQVVSKYIGETEKNLRRVFDAAEAGGAILLFDEADALFGKRSEVKDSRDRYANLEVSYLLQRMESYRGLAILTTNLRESFDPAFMRRLRFVVQFPSPDASLRQEIWRRMIPAGAPTEGLDFRKLARLDVCGGNIRTIALNAAFRAADEGSAIRMAHVLYAVRSEFTKLGRRLLEAEVAGWV